MKAYKLDLKDKSKISGHLIFGTLAYIMDDVQTCITASQQLKHEQGGVVDVGSIPERITGMLRVKHAGLGN
jgi:hypothetical protein